MAGDCTSMKNKQSGEVEGPTINPSVISYRKGKLYMFYQHLVSKPTDCWYKSYRSGNRYGMEVAQAI